MRRRGFTLIEMMMVVVVVDIGSALAAYNMADHVRDAPTRAEVNDLVQPLRTEHRRAREQLHSLKLQSAGHEVTFTPMRDAACAVAVGTPRVEKHRYASLAILNAPSAGACFNDRGVIIGSGSNTGVGPIGGGESTNVGGNNGIP